MKLFNFPILLCLFTMASAFSFSLANAESTAISVDELKQRFELKTDVYTLDPTGKRVLSGPNSSGLYRTNTETGRVRGDASSISGENKIFLRYDATILDDGTIKFSIEEFKNGGESYSGSLGKKEFILENFEPLVWKPKQKNPDNMVVRFMPMLRENTKALSMDGFPLSGTNVIITDSAGYLWADEMGFSAKFSGFKTHRGSLVISYSPFKGSKELGIAEGKKILLTLGKDLKVKIVSETDFLPNGITAKVYGLYDPNEKSKRANSVHGWDSNSEDRILKGFRN
jgi:hypothetical protein